MLILNTMYIYAGRCQRAITQLHCCVSEICYPMLLSNTENACPRITTEIQRNWICFEGMVCGLTAAQQIAQAIIIDYCHAIAVMHHKLDKGQGKRNTLYILDIFIFILYLYSFYIHIIISLAAFHPFNLYIRYV